LQRKARNLERTWVPELLEEGGKKKKIMRGGGRCGWGSVATGLQCRKGRTGTEKSKPKTGKGQKREAHLDWRGGKPKKPSLQKRKEGKKRRLTTREYLWVLVQAVKRKGDTKKGGNSLRNAKAGGRGSRRKIKDTDCTCAVKSSLQEEKLPMRRGKRRGGSRIQQPRDLQEKTDRSSVCKEGMLGGGNDRVKKGLGKKDLPAKSTGPGDKGLQSSQKKRGRKRKSLWGGGGLKKTHEQRKSKQGICTTSLSKQVPDFPVEEIVGKGGEVDFVGSPN